jgi:hypothetical protein
MKKPSTSKVLLAVAAPITAELNPQKTTPEQLGSAMTGAQ